MTRVNNEQVHVGLNGEDAVVELNKAADGKVSINRRILVQNPGRSKLSRMPIGWAMTVILW